MITREYLALCLRFGEHIEGFVDAYFGPADLKDRVDAEDVKEPRALLERAHELRHDLFASDLEEQRRRWLGAQLDALICVGERLSGIEMSWSEEVRRCFGVFPKRFSEDVFREAHALLDGVLEGRGDLRDRYQTWTRQDAVPKDLLREALGILGEDFQERTSARFPLPEDEHVEYELVDDAPWQAFNWYLGGHRSRVSVNAGLPVEAAALPTFVAHEAYPGHHTERCLKEHLLVRNQGREELTAPIVSAPEMLISEGIASLALDQLLETVPSEQFLVSLFAQVGFEYRAEVSSVVRKAEDLLMGVLVNAAYLLHEEGKPSAKVVEYVGQWSLRGSEYAEHGVRFVSDPTWRAYASSYTDGPRVCRDFIAANPGGFSRLLTEQLTVSDLLAP